MKRSRYEDDSREQNSYPKKYSHDNKSPSSHFRRNGRISRDSPHEPCSSSSRESQTQQKISECKVQESRNKYEDHRKLGKSYNKPEDSNSDFTFERFRHELNQVYFRDENFIDQEDFWKFLKKYESVQKKASDLRRVTKEDLTRIGTQEDNPLGLPQSFDKSHLVSVCLTSSADEDRKRLLSRSVSWDRLVEFRSVLLLYIDFQQREKFTKLRKLRESQANLPVAQYREQIVSSMLKDRVVVIAGDTGCGKSTQVPQYLLKAGFKRIACTQPRRIACISLCKRVAYETLNEFGSEVGYQIRFEKSKTQHTKIVFVTEGLLLRQVSTDPTLSGYDVVVLDEVHERHLHGDFLLGVVKCLLYQRSDLKIVLMSATINIQLFSSYFSNYATVVQVPGRLYPIKLYFQPVLPEDKSSKTSRINPAPYVRIMQLIDEKYPREEKGDLLIFLSGMSEISAVVDAAKDYSHKSQNWVVLPLHSTLSIAEQDKCFDYPPEGVRKCVVSTNIAETSITIDGIRFVVDSGKVKEMSYDPLCKMQRLKEFWISRASAEQRKGRAGRTGPGVCYRLYSEEEYHAMSQYTTPEIQRVPLDSLLLQMVAMGLPDARKFPFIEPPPPDSIENAITTLKQQGALTEEEKLTVVGRMLSRLPVDISLGKMLIMGSLFHQVDPVLSLAAALSVQSPFTNRAFRDPDCETSRKQLESDHGDPITLLNALKEWLEVKNSSEGRGRGSHQWCRRRGLEEQRFYEMIKLRRQFKDLLQDAGLLKDTSIPPEQLSSAERALRHGELRLLRSLKREHREAAPKKRRTLKLDVWEVAVEGGNEEGEIDIKDVEFRLSNDSSQVQKDSNAPDRDSNFDLPVIGSLVYYESYALDHATAETGAHTCHYNLQSLLSGATACSYKDVMMLKVILCSGLYPQLAVADEFNHCKSVSEQLFHTTGKPYVALHPMGFFGNHAQVLQLEESDIVIPQGHTSKLPVSSKHQLLCYMSLLETTKPYLVTTLRIPAAQTLLLFSQSIDTNSDFSRLVCDSWLLLEFPVPEAATNLLLKAAKLRNKWEELLNLRLEAVQPAVRDETKSASSAFRLERELSSDLPRFMHTEIVYTLKRLMAADLKRLHVGPDAGEFAPLCPNPFHPSWESCPHPVKGGVQVTSYLTYNCLLQEEVTQEFETWHCPSCDLVASLSPMERLLHSQTCPQKQDNTDSKMEEEDPPSSRKPNSQPFYCEHCQKTLHLTPTETLRHKKQHSL
uniref:(California timema) hypothetical protein n=1 Tax=Timema californicum TaxID=61474 RepID=A0A7R9J953_TIMCA|nr:unnamed protein product [Timema californicum]